MQESSKNWYHRQLQPTTTPAPMSLHLSWILLLIATLPFSNRQTGLLNCTSILSPLTLVTFERTGAVPTLSLNDSPTCTDETFISSAEPTAVSKRFISSFAIEEFSGNVLGFPITEPISESLRVIDGSSFVPIATKPPGLTSSTSPAPVPREEISVMIGS